MSQARVLDSREIGRRLRIRGILELTAPAHLGGADPDATSDQPLLRDAQGRPYLPGSTLKGLLRGLLKPGPAVTGLFGADWAKEGRQARLLVDDAPVVEQAEVATEVRDGVRISPTLGLAEDQKKYDLELLPKGTRFELTLELLLAGGGEQLRPDDATLVAGLLSLLQALEQGELRIGAGTRRGRGATKLVGTGQSGGWRWTDCRLPVRTQVLAWLGQELAGLPKGWPTVAERNGSAQELARRLGVPLPSQVSRTDWSVKLQLRLASPLIIRSPGQAPEDADARHLSRPSLTPAGASQLEPILSGTSLAGVLRHRCLRIAQTLAGPDRLVPAKQLIEALFGPERIERGQPNGARPRAWASRVRVDEAVITAGRFLRQTRVRIDPWTGGAAENLLFTEDLLHGGQVRVELVVARTSPPDEPQERAGRALLLLALRDLASGELTVGGEGSVGRGRFAPGGAGGLFGEVVLPEGRVALTLDREGRVATLPQAAFTQDFAALHKLLRKNLPGRGER